MELEEDRIGEKETIRGLEFDDIQTTASAGC